MKNLRWKIEIACESTFSETLGKSIINLTFAMNQEKEIADFQIHSLRTDIRTKERKIPKKTRQFQGFCWKPWFNQ
jgi:hypothetical protein